MYEPSMMRRLEDTQRDIRSVATGDPNNLGRGIMRRNQINKIPVFTHYCDSAPWRALRGNMENTPTTEAGDLCLLDRSLLDEWHLFYSTLIIGNRSWVPLISHQQKIPTPYGVGLFKNVCVLLCIRFSFLCDTARLPVRITLSRIGGEWKVLG